MHLDWEIGLITKDWAEQSWQELAESLRLFFDSVRFHHPDEILAKGFHHNFLITDNKHVFVKAQEADIGCLYLPIPPMRHHLAELFKRMAFGFLTPDAYKDKD
jgi:hypothetical protein